MYEGRAVKKVSAMGFTRVTGFGGAVGDAIAESVGGGLGGGVDDEVDAVWEELCRMAVTGYHLRAAATNFGKTLVAIDLSDGDVIGACDGGDGSYRR